MELQGAASGTVARLPARQLRELPALRVSLAAAWRERTLARPGAVQMHLRVVGYCDGRRGGCGPYDSTRLGYHAGRPLTACLAAMWTCAGPARWSGHELLELVDLGRPLGGSEPVLPRYLGRLMPGKIDAVGLIVTDLERSVRFYRLLGAPFPEGAEQSGHGHAEAVLAGGFRLLLDTEAAVGQFDPAWTPPAGEPRASVAFRCTTPAEVDELFVSATAAGGRAHMAPWDAFWGQRYAQLRDPDGNGVDLYADLASTSAEAANPRTAALARRFELTQTRFVDLVESLTDAQWETVGRNFPERLNDEDEGRTVGVIAHHVAVSGPWILDRIEAMLQGRQLTPPDIRAVNAHHATEQADVSRDEVLGVLRRTLPAMLARVRAIPDDQLDQSRDSPAGPMSVAQRLERVLIGHVQVHRGSIEAAIAGGTGPA